MFKKTFVLTALISMIPVLQITAMSVENMQQEYNFWLKDLSEMCEGFLREITLSDSLTNKQAMWYLANAVFHKEKMELLEDISYTLTEKSYQNYLLNVEICNNKINFINNALIQLDEAVSLVEKEYSMSSGQFKAQAIEFVESHDLEELVSALPELTTDVDF